MATTYRNLEEGRQCEIVLRIRDCTKVSVKNRAYELSVEDVEGTRFQFIIWESSEQGMNCDWEEGCWYRLSGVTVNEWLSGTVPHGTSSLDVEYIGTKQNEAQVDLLYLTDSHLGKTSHSYGGSSWSVSPNDGFQSAIEQAISRNVDAVVHGGDLFHNPGDGIGEEEIAVCREGLVALAQEGIPFYFVYGNHERQAGRRILEQFIDNSLAVHLGPRYELIEGRLALYGIDHQSDWADFVPDLERAPDKTKTMLCVHQSMAPFTEGSTQDCALRELQEDANIHLDLVITGHVHTRSEYEFETYQGLSGGSTTRVGESRNDLQPSVELISLNGGQPNPQQELL